MAEDAPALESAWPPVAAVLVLLALNVAYSVAEPATRRIGRGWALPVAEAALLVVLVSGLHRHRNRRTARRLAIVLVGLLVASALGATVELIVLLIHGGPETASAGTLLASGALVWAGNNVAFALLYWLLDSGGPAERALRPREHPDLAFPQQLNPQLAPPGWRPVFWDYLYLGFTNAVALSPTDVMPLARPFKLAMAVQAAVSLALVALVIARAVNILT